MNPSVIKEMKGLGLIPHARTSKQVPLRQVDFSSTTESRVRYVSVVSESTRYSDVQLQLDQLDARFATIYKPHIRSAAVSKKAAGVEVPWNSFVSRLPKLQPSAKRNSVLQPQPSAARLNWKTVQKKVPQLALSNQAVIHPEESPKKTQTKSTTPQGTASGTDATPQGTGEVELDTQDVTVESKTARSARGAAQRNSETKVKAVYGVTRGDLPNVTYVMLLINGGHTARLDMLHAVRMGWDIIVFKGTGGFADEVAKERERRATNQDDQDAIEKDADVEVDEGRKEKQAPFDSTLDEILTFGKINAIDLTQDSVEDVTSLCVSRIHRVGGHVHEGGDRVLFQAWQTYAIYSKTALQLSLSHTRIELVSMVLKLATVVLLTVDTQYGTRTPRGVGVGGDELNFLTAFIAAGPVVVAVLTAIKNHFNYGIKYIIMHGAAQQMRSQIFSYRSGSGKYSDKHFRGSRLAATMRRITGDVIKSECQNVSLQSLEQQQATYRLPVRDVAGIRIYVFHMVCNNRRWDLVDMVLILSSSLCSTLSITGVPSKIVMGILTHRFGISFFFSFAFTLQLVLNLLGFGSKQFWRQWWMRFDTLIVFVSWLDFMVDFGEYARFIRMLRIARIGKLLAKSAGAMDKKQRQKTLNLHAKDPALSTIDADDYISFRLDKALSDIKKDTNFLHTHYTCFAMFTYILSGVTAILGLTDMGIWAVVAIGSSNFCEQILLLNQSEVRLKSANETVLQLVSTRAWWNALSSGDHIKQQNLTRLVEVTEKLIDSYITSTLSALKTAIDDEEEEEEKSKKKKQRKKKEALRRTQKQRSGKGMGDAPGQLGIMAPSDTLGLQRHGSVIAHE
jgi:hypothetical protein